MNQQSPAYTITARTETRVALAVAGVPVPVVIEQRDDHSHLNDNPGIFTEWDVDNVAHRSIRFHTPAFTFTALSRFAALAAGRGLLVLAEAGRSVSANAVEVTQADADALRTLPGGRMRACGFGPA